MAHCYVSRLDNGTSRVLSISNLYTYLFFQTAASSWILICFTFELCVVIAKPAAHEDQGIQNAIKHYKGTDAHQWIFVYIFHQVKGFNNIKSNNCVV
jgi:hypothetical protein